VTSLFAVEVVPLQKVGVNQIARSRRNPADENTVRRLAIFILEAIRRGIVKRLNRTKSRMQRSIEVAPLGLNPIPRGAMTAIWGFARTTALGEAVRPTDGDDLPSPWQTPPSTRDRQPWPKSVTACSHIVTTNVALAPWATNVALAP
jgi:hypothetical protein